MDSNQNVYIMKRTRNGTGACFFYKNGLLHREAGPAIVTVANRDDLLNLGDEHLYKEIAIDTKFPNGYTPMMLLENEIINGRTVQCHNIAVFYLNGHPYTEEEFEEIKVKLKLKEALNDELNITTSQIKRTKV